MNYIKSEKTVSQGSGVGLNMQKCTQLILQASHVYVAAKYRTILESIYFIVAQADLKSMQNYLTPVGKELVQC